MRAATLFLICSLQALAACSGKIKRPDMNVFFMNVPAAQMQGNNVLHDYDDNGVRTAPGYTQFKPLSTLDQVNEMFCTDAPGLKAGKTSATDARNYIKNHCKCN